MRPQRILFVYLLIHTVVPNLYYYDLLGESLKGTKSEKIVSEIHILQNFLIVNVFNVNEFIFTLCVMAPTFMIGIGFQVYSFCMDGESYLNIEDTEVSCSSF